LSAETHDNIELALHEAFNNALIHGNLQLDSIAALSVDALERFSADLMRRITDPSYASRRIDVVCGLDDTGITIDVIDQGDGFTARPRQEGGASGRGLALISASCQSYRLLDQGRRVSMRFAL
jgi:anti-sigma regulatory factor (Ser/Thr protein kinase)